MEPTFKDLTNYIISLGAADIAHTEKTYLAHAIGVYNDLKAWGCDEGFSRTGLFHSIYGTQQFQGFTLPLERQSELRSLIGDYAEKICFVNCFMDRASLDAQLDQTEGPYTIIHRETGEEMILTKDEYDDLVRLHLCDLLEQVERSQAWDARRIAFRKMAERLGGVALEAYDRVFEREPVHV
ncbi:hypothetical protein KFU94_41520 [Chloroflexi bacterium TSY]|nr:hypothetical protein [Chloroflexi bacterium TSY]